MEVTAELVRELLHYDPDTGIFTWKKRDRKWFPSNNSYFSWNSRLAGKRAGSEWQQKSGYKLRQIKIFGKYHREHRLAWLYMKGAFPD